MSGLLPIFILLVSTGSIIFGYYLMRNPRALDLDIPRWVAWVLLVCGVMGLLGFDLWLVVRVTGGAT
ncbi:MAG: hypothetical protein WCD37_05045 [Chloroflexia bacterium]